MTPLLGGLIGMAWLSLWAWGASPYGRYLDHHSLEGVGAKGWLVVLAFILGWFLMTVAMMLPSSLPLVLLFRGMVHQRRERGQLVALLLVGYLSVWMLFGFVAHAADGVLHAVVAAWPWLAAHAGGIGVAMVLGAGIYQLTPLKAYCLSQCRSPRSFVLMRWRGRRPAAEAFRLGVDHGLFCLGCCWSLMLLMFGIGLGSLAWMLGLGVLMAMEKNLRWTRHLTRPVGMGLIGWACLELALIAAAH